MGSGYIMSLDQGTETSRCLIFDRAGRCVASERRKVRQVYPRPGWVEQDPRDIWETQRAAAASALAQNRLTAGDIDAIGIANQRETVIVWDRASGKPVHNAIVWQCRRTAGICGRLREAGHEPMVIEKTGLPIDPYFSGTKLKWLLDSVPRGRERARAGELLFGTVDSWLLWKLTGGAVHATDFTNASRTMLFNIHSLDWDDELLALLDIPRRLLPEVRPSRHIFGSAEAGVFGRAIPVAGIAGDQQAALFGQLCCGPGCAKNTYGVGCFLLLHTGKRPVRSRSGLLTTIAAGGGPPVDYALEGAIFTAGDMLRWLTDEMGLIRSPEESERLATSVADTAGVQVVPALVGLGAPYWNPRARACVTGLSHTAGRAHIIRAVLEGIAHLSRDVLLAMEQDLGSPIASLKVDGSMSANNFLMQFQANILDRDVIRPDLLETTALGAAFLAGLEVGLWADLDELRSLFAGSTMFSTAISGPCRDRLTGDWRRAVETALYWARTGGGAKPAGGGAACS